MYWGDELVAIYNEAYIGKYYLQECFATELTCTRAGRSKTSGTNGSEL